ncbi:MAG: helix-turn-helix domain-containing protein [Gemmatimonadaceae bacterium]|nr:helix-turn-helix domain-containing protein [Gemmatimonadaceae bacterium]
MLLTAKAGAAAQVAGYEAGADAYLVKPFEPSVLEACVGGLLAQRRRLRDRFRADPGSVSGAVQAVTIGASPTHETDGADDGPTGAGSGPSALQTELRAIIVARLTDPTLAPETLAAAAGRSYHQLYRALQGELGWSPSRFIRSVRVECAAELLRQGRGSVTEVAYAVGFESLSYFGRAFRERFGANPGSFAAKGVSAGRSGRAG